MASWGVGVKGVIYFYRRNTPFWLFFIYAFYRKYSLPFVEVQLVVEMETRGEMQNKLDVFICGLMKFVHVLRNCASCKRFCVDILEAMMRGVYRKLEFKLGIWVQNTIWKKHDFETVYLEQAEILRISKQKTKECARWMLHRNLVYKTELVSQYIGLPTRI